MAELTTLDEKLGEVLGLAQAAQDTTAKVARMEGAEDFEELLGRMGREAAETERRTDDLVDDLEGRKTAIREKARETKQEAAEMRDTYLAGEDEALDGFEFLTMAEAGELGHWEIVKTMSETLGEQQVRDLADEVCGIQERHFQTARQASLQLAQAEARG
jgi:hypothetical protein